MKLRAITQSIKAFSIKEQYRALNVGAVPFTAKASRWESKPWTRVDYAMLGAGVSASVVGLYNYVFVDGIFEIQSLSGDILYREYLVTPSQLVIDSLPMIMLALFSSGVILYVTRSLRNGYFLAEPVDRESANKEVTQEEPKNKAQILGDVLIANDIPYYKYQVELDGKLVTKTRKGFISIDYMEGKVVDTYHVEFNKGFKSKDIPNMSRDLKLRRGQDAVIIDNAGDGKVGIEIPANRSDEDRTIKLSDWFDSEEWKAFSKKSTLPVLIGEKTNGKMLAIDLMKSLHIFAAGATGQGKSVGINTALLSLLFSGANIKLSLHDPKRVELTPYKKCNRLLHSICTDMADSVRELEKLNTEMDERYQMFEKLGVRDISGYNNKSDIELPYIIVLFDELANAVQSNIQLSEEKGDTAGAAINNLLANLAQLSRAAGIILYCSTQKPSAKVFDELLLANLPTRIGYTVRKHTDSQVAINETGCEKLLGRGDLLLNHVGSSSSVRGHGAFVSDEELETLIHESNRLHLKAVA